MKTSNGHLCCHPFYRFCRKFTSRFSFVSSYPFFILFFFSTLLYSLALFHALLILGFTMSNYALLAISAVCAGCSIRISI
ncbi:uncharacterized protein NEPG_02010 [Nematocida parisii ERTm1]|uniref:Uncharacterized protein n=1 Tax=Nematocida parisii (strain ERTm3) TaxID=935791 RepID=I3EF36_NEMP3|nr:uncharacterized protein NEPG_02010 [Nematocida parisii ERTm1]EIJ87833.1 hypothetical protein NEQG_01905 [Nematocida parisii ERTm3]EIJ93054.1 hypothetical protein NEPG_02010 [Nematocida parisii ERTm1]|eukprot:XP_013059837.1 hypothetical protein NEPG_02010 [Nematocida parisii ERTm1]